MFKMKKTMLAGAVLAALFSATAFAADNAAPDADQNAKAANNYCYDYGRCPGYDGHRGWHRWHNGPLTPDEIKERDARRAEWAKLTPEQREEKRKEWRAEREKQREEWRNMTPAQRQAKREEWRTAYEKRREAALNKLTKEQREEVENFIKAERQHRKEVREKLDKMTPEQRAALRICDGPFTGHRYDRDNYRSHRSDRIHHK